MIGRLAACLTVIGCCFFSDASSQSTLQDFPTPVSSNEISGTITAREIGDSRMTQYFYVFDGDQGDIFVNLLTRNFTGDIDIFVQNGLRPLSKIVIFADLPENETGRVIYLRKPERLLLRIQGRTPNDEHATFQIKFAGSFIAVKDTGNAVPEMPTVAGREDTGIRVNSVGTILEVRPKPTSEPKAGDEVARTGVKEGEQPSAKSEETKDTVPRTDGDKDAVAKAETPKTEEAEKPSKPEVVVTENLPPAKTNPPARTRRPTARDRRNARRAAPPMETAADAETKKDDRAETPAKTTRTRVAKAATPKPPDPMANFRLVVVFKDGAIIERPMIEVFRFTVDKGILTVIGKDGRVGRYSMVDILKVSIE